MGRTTTFRQAPLLARGPRVTFAEKLSRLGGRLKDPEWRRYGKLLVGGKMLGLGLVLLVMLAVRIAPEVFSSGSVVAQEATPAARRPPMQRLLPPIRT